ncbi:MAG: AraC family transcriptional regulator [Pseudomonadota bacterium]
MTAHIGVLELLIRGAAAGGFVLLAGGVIGSGRSPARVTGALFSTAAAAHVLTQSPTAFEGLGAARGPVWVLSVMGAGLFWAFAMELFGDHARLSPLRLVPSTLLLAIGVAATLSPPTAARLIWLSHNLVGAGLMLHLLLTVWTGWRGDLVEARRRLRGPLLGVAALYALVVVGVQSAELFSRPAHELSMLAAVSLLIISFASGAVFLRADPQLFGTARVSGREPRVTAPDQVLLARLRAALDGEELWRREGLTIGALAASLGAPEHHLRRLINEGLGYRNFTAFINERRVEAAKQMLSDPSKARTTIATVAYEVGFSSLGPFNRAFRAGAGRTPTAWRRTAQAGWSIPEAG